jgi:adenylate cyclase
LLVIARDSSFVFKGQARDIREIGRILGVRYVLEGSVRKAGNRVRLAAQLIDSLNGSHVWQTVSRVTLTTYSSFRIG